MIAIAVLNLPIAFIWQEDTVVGKTFFLARYEISLNTVASGVFPCTAINKFIVVILRWYAIIRSPLLSYHIPTGRQVNILPILLGRIAVLIQSAPSVAVTNLSAVGSPDIHVCPFHTQSQIYELHNIYLLCIAV